MGLPRRRKDPFHPTRQTRRELLRRELQRQVPRRMPQRPLVHQPRRRQDEDRNLETRLQRGQAAQLAWRPDAHGVFINGRTRSLGGPEIGVRSEELDSDLGLINLRARQYKPGIGRFLRIDPGIGRLLTPDSLNKYLYANGDPVNLMDPTGRDALEYAGAVLFGSGMANRVGMLFLFTVRIATRLQEDPNATFQNRTFKIIHETAAFYSTLFGAVTTLSLGT